MTSRDLILEADQNAREQGYNQTKWSTEAGYAKNGQTVSRIINKGDCRLSTFLALIKPLGMELTIKKITEEEAEK